MPREGEYMAENIIVSVICFILGIGISALNYLISKKMLLNHSDKYSYVTIIRQIIQVAFLVAVYVLAVVFKLNPVYALIGGVLGNTSSMVFFTKKLLNVNKSAMEAKKNG